MTRGYKFIQRLKAQHRIRIDDLLVLSPDNDPFYAGSSNDLVLAQWFGDLYTRHCRRLDHLRGIHYTAFSVAFLKPDDTPYAQPPPGLSDEARRNYVTADWAMLQRAARKARYLAFIPPLDLDDKRNREPVCVEMHTPVEPGVVLDGIQWRLPAIEVTGAEIAIPSPEVVGFEYRDCDQPIFISLWIEKSTMDDTLEPLCRRLGIEYLSGMGYQSIRRIIEFLGRVADDGRPALILYISDWDLAGENMPVQVARQIEFWIDDHAPGATVALLPLGLSEAQITEWGLEDAIAPGKTRDIVELDAVKVLRPGTFEALIDATVTTFRDEALEADFEAAAEEAFASVESLWADAVSGQTEEADTIVREAEAVLGRHRSPIDAVVQALNSDLAPLQARLDALERDFDAVWEEFDPELPDRPQSDIDLDPEDDEHELLFHSERTYEQQLDTYRAHRGQDPVFSDDGFGMVECEYDGKLFRPLSTLGKYCSDECSRAARYERKHGEIAVRTCPVCEMVFTPKKRDAMCCPARSCKQKLSYVRAKLREGKPLSELEQAVLERSEDGREITRTVKRTLKPPRPAGG